MGARSPRSRWRPCAALALPLLLAVAFLDLQRFGVDGAACKGCAPPCICPGTKGEKARFGHETIKFYSTISVHLAGVEIIQR